MTASAPPAPAEIRTSGSLFRRDIFLRRYRFRRIREWGSGQAEVAMTVAARQAGLYVEDAQITKLPREDLFETARRSKREKKCGDTNDQTCANDLHNNADCRWTIDNRSSDLVYSDTKLGVGGPDFCAPVELYVNWFELDRDPGTVMTTIVDNILSPIGCLGPIFSNPGAGLVERVVETVQCGLQTYFTVRQLHDQIMNAGYTERQDLGSLETGVGDTPNVPVPLAVGSTCVWTVPTEQAGDIEDTWKGKTAQAEFEQVVVALGPAVSIGDAGCPCSTFAGAVPGEADVRYLQVGQQSSCELRCEVHLRQVDLKDPAQPRRVLEVCFDTDDNDGTGDPAFPNCGADHRVIFRLDGVPGGSPPHVDVSRGVSHYDMNTGTWSDSSLAVEGVYDVRVTPCGLSFSVNLSDIGNPAPPQFVDAWCVARNQSGAILSVLPGNGGCIDPLELQLQGETVCPTVVDIHMTALQYGNKTASIRVDFSEAVNPVTSGQVMINPTVPFTVSMSGNAKSLFIHPNPAFAAYEYTVTLDGSITDCAGNGLAAEVGAACGTGKTFQVCVPEVNLAVTDATGTPQTSFPRGDNIFIVGSGLEPFPNSTITAYVTPVSVLQVSGILPPVLIDETGGPLTHGPDTFTPATSTSFTLKDLGTCTLDGEYAIVLDVNNDGLYEKNVDRTLNPCQASFYVGCGSALRAGGECQPCSDTIGARIAYWPLNEDYTGAGIKDFEGDHDGASVGAPTFAPGKRGNAIFFDALNTGHFVVPAADDLAVRADEEFSLSGWVNPTSASGAYTILDDRGSGLGYRLSLVSGKLTLQLADGSGVGTYLSTASVPTGTWTHFFVAVDRSAVNALRMYLNGALDSFHDASAHNGTLDGGSDLWIGGDQVTSGAAFLGGLDELAMWDEPLTSAEVLSLYNADAQDLPCPLDPATGVVDPLPAGPTPASGVRMLRSPGSPFRDALRITLDMPREGGARLGVYNASGRRIATIADGALTAGMHEFTWDARSGSAGVVASGVYFLRLEALGRSETEKVVLIR